VEDPNYAEIETVQQSADATLVRAIRRADGRSVLLKFMRSAGQQRRRRLLDNERRIGRSAASSTILRPVDLATIDGQQALVLEDFGGHPLEDDLDRAMDLETVLVLAIGIARALGDLHARGVIHRDLKPQHVFVERESGTVRLTGLGVALSSAGSYRSPSEAGLIEGTFAYMAPEQTGHGGGLVDERADLYSFGVLLHRMSTGKLPLEANDALGWVYAHVATRPLPTAASSDVPPAVGAIVDKLLAKDPEERYQTAAGVVADLEHALASLRSGEALLPFVLGSHDISERLLIPRRLHGRDAELATLTAALERATTEESEIVFLVGPAGIGKSALAEALEARVPSTGIFIQGKHEELRRDVPYYAVTQALEQLAGRLLMENEEKLARWRKTLSDALGENAALLCSLVPRFALLLSVGSASIEDTPSSSSPVVSSSKSSSSSATRTVAARDRSVIACVAPFTEGVMVQKPSRGREHPKPMRVVAGCGREALHQ
jgi:serine/threonine protein kinase